MRKHIVPIINCICLIPFIMTLSTAFIIDHSFPNATVSGKYFWFYISIGLTSLATAISYIVNQKNIKFSFVDLTVLLFCTLGGLLTYLINQEITTKLILLVLALILYSYFRIFLFQYKTNSYFLIVSLIAIGLIEAIWGLKQLYGFSHSQHHLFKTTGSFFNPGPYAGYIAIIFPMALYYILKDWRVFKLKFRTIFIPFYLRWAISCLAFIAILITLPATMSRASWIAALVGCTLVSLLYFLQVRYSKAQAQIFFRKHKKKIFITAASCIVLLGICLTGVYHIKKDSADGRALIWKISLQTISDHSIGVGSGNFAGVYGDHQAKYFESGNATEQEEHVAGNPEYAFNEYLQLCIEFGVIPFILFIVTIVGAIYIGIKRKKIATVGGLVTLLVFASMSYPFSILPYVIVFVLLLALCVSKGHTITHNQDLQHTYVFNFHKRSFLNKIIISSILSFCILITILCLYNRYPTRQAYKEWNQAKAFYNTGSYEKASDIYNKIYPYLNDQISFLFEYAQCLSKTERYDESNIVLLRAIKISCDPMLYTIIGKNYQAMGQYNKAEEHFIKSTNIIPSRLYSSYLLAKMYQEMGEYEKAIKTATLILNKEPKVNSPAVKEIKSEMKKLLETPNKIEL